MADVWPLRHNWRNPYRVTYEFQTQIKESRSGREQRRAMRQTPRKTVELMNSAHRDRYEALMRALSVQQGPDMLLPELTDCVWSAGGMDAGETSIPVPFVPQWAVPGQQVILVDGDRARARTIVTGGPGELAFAEPTLNPWPARTRICRALQGTLADSLSVNVLLNNLAEGTIRFNVDPGSEWPVDPGEAEDVFDGREVFVESADWGQGRDLTFDRTIEFVDYGRGRVNKILPTAFGRRTLTANYLAKSWAEAYRLRDFFLRQKGRLHEFYAPTDLADMRLVDDIGGALLSVAGIDASYYENDPVNKAVCVKMRNGDRYYRKVTGIVGQGETTNVQLNAAINADMASVEVISWMPLMRLATDELTFEWATDRVAQVRFTYQTLEYRSAEVFA